MSFQPSFGRLEPTEEHTELHSTLYSWNQYLPLITASVERELPYDPLFVTWFNQGNKNACVGASTAQYMAVMNSLQGTIFHYDWWKHYCKACEIDGNNETSCARDIGTFIWAGMDVLRKFGAYLFSADWKVEHGISNYYWCQNADDMRTAISIGRPLQFGLPWFREWMTPIIKNGERWLPPRNQWKTLGGGHAIASFQVSDMRQGLKLTNTWGDNYAPVWVSYDDINYLLKERGGECAVGVDITVDPPVPPEPEPEPEEIKIEKIELFYDNKKVYEVVI
jgi:hypothetical protein